MTTQPARHDDPIQQPGKHLPDPARIRRLTTMQAAQLLGDAAQHGRHHRRRHNLRILSDLSWQALIALGSLAVIAAASLLTLI